MTNETESKYFDFLAAWTKALKAIENKYSSADTDITNPLQTDAFEDYVPDGFYDKDLEEISAMSDEVVSTELETRGYDELAIEKNVNALTSDNVFVFKNKQKEVDSALIIQSTMMSEVIRESIGKSFIYSRREDTLALSHSEAVQRDYVKKTQKPTSRVSCFLSYMKSNVRGGKPPRIGRIVYGVAASLALAIPGIFVYEHVLLDKSQKQLSINNNSHFATNVFSGDGQVNGINIENKTQLYTLASSTMTLSSIIGAIPLKDQKESNIERTIAAHFAQIEKIQKTEPEVLNETIGPVRVKNWSYAADHLGSSRTKKVYLSESTEPGGYDYNAKDGQFRHPSEGTYTHLAHQKSGDVAVNQEPNITTNESNVPSKLAIAENTPYERFYSAPTEEKFNRYSVDGMMEWERLASSYETVDNSNYRLQKVSYSNEESRFEYTQINNRPIQNASLGPERVNEFLTEIKSESNGLTQNERLILLDTVKRAVEKDKDELIAKGHNYDDRRLCAQVNKHRHYVTKGDSVFGIITSCGYHINHNDILKLEEVLNIDDVLIFFFDATKTITRIDIQRVGTEVINLFSAS